MIKNHLKNLISVNGQKLDSFNLNRFKNVYLTSFQIQIGKLIMI